MEGLLGVSSAIIECVTGGIECVTGGLIVRNIAGPFEESLGKGSSFWGLLQPILSSFALADQRVGAGLGAKGWVWLLGQLSYLAKPQVVLCLRSQQKDIIGV